VQGLRELGYVNGTNLVLEWRSAEGKFERFHDIVRERVSIKVDVIVTINNSMTRAMTSGNPVKDGLIQSLARPGGNITGLTTYTGLEISTKQVQLLKEIVPRMSRVVVLLQKPETLADWKQIAEAITRELGVKLLRRSLTFSAAWRDTSIGALKAPNPRICRLSSRRIGTHSPVVYGAIDGES
jgi:ABC-type uncharacterized transport system substrate-binding protein